MWFGNDDNTPMNKVTGGSLPALAWRNFMLAATKAMPLKSLPSAPVADDTPLDRLFGWFSTQPPAPATPASLPMEPDRYPGPRVGN